MFTMMTMMMMIFCLSVLILIINTLMSMKLSKFREKMSPFECGFDPFSSARMPFSIQFFLICLIFLIFDVEITLLIPLVFLLYKFNNMYVILSFIFLIILIFGLMIEYLEKSIDWKL